MTSGSMPVRNQPVLDHPAPELPLARAIARLEGAGPLLQVQRTVYLVVNRALAVVATLGAATLLAEGEGLVGRPLLEVAPHLRAMADRLPELLEGAAPVLHVGSVAGDPAVAGAPPLQVLLLPLIEEEAIVGLLYVAQDASPAAMLQDRNERQRRELFELRQRIGQLNLDLALANSELRRLDDAKSQFVSAAAHELRNPLASLLGYIELITEEDTSNLTATQNQFIANISRSAQRLRQLTSNLLDITRLDSNRLELVMTTTDPIDLLEVALGDMQPLFDAKRQRVLVKAEPALPAIWCDRARALQILTNLLSNACKYTPAGGSITAQVSRQKGRPFVAFRIKDSGIGIPAEDQMRLFTRFYRASNATAADGTGAGLGLAITQSLVRLHGGKIWFESKEGKGTSFFVTLPVAG
ncbi:MAG: sensor histidine kinase [Caldilineaceae bacterium]